MTRECLWNKDTVKKLIFNLSNIYTINPNEFVVNIAMKSNQNTELNYFEILITIVLSQNTSDRNAIRAFNALKNMVKEVTPKNILAIDDESLKNAIRVAGLANRKSNVLKKLAYIMSSKPEFFREIALLDVEEARKKLLELPGIGFKTADVFLLLVLKKPTFPIDTHINRVVRRLGIADPGDGYEDIRLKIVKLLESDIDSLSKLHMLLIIHGRRVCTSRNPKCSLCTVSELCCKIIQ
ncbi:MAG: endonuclease III [Ignisphaera sp.]